MRALWGRLSLRSRLASAFGLLAAFALFFVLAIIARTLGPASLARGKILPAAAFGLLAFFVGGWFVAGWCLDAISRLGARINESPRQRMPVELEGLAALLRHEAQKRDRLLQELRRFTADASHELRTPLTALRTVGEVALRSSSATPAELHDTIGSMLEEAERMNGLVSQLLRLARVESEGLMVRPRVVHLAVHLGAFCDGVLVLAEEKQIELKLICAQELTVTTDVSLLGHAITNLLNNAIQHSPSGSKVSLSAHSESGKVFIDVSDEGPGIPKEHQERIFERFYRVDTARSREKGGFGLGLCIAKTSVGRLGGTITVASVPGAGATFQVALPVGWTDQESCR